MKHLLCLACLLSQLPAPPSSPPPPPPSPGVGAPRNDNRLDVLSAAIEKALEAWDVDEARLLMVQVEELNLHGLALLHYLQGRMAFQLGLYEEAADEFVLAGQEDKPGTFLRLAKAGQRFAKTAQRFESEHFVLFVPPGKQAALAGYALHVLEAQYEALKTDLGFSSREKLRVEVAGNARELAALAGVPFEKWLESGTPAFCAFGKLILLSPSALQGGFAWQNTLAHAYARFAIAKQTRNQAPPWLQLALAGYLESRWENPPPPPLPKANWAALQQQMRASNTLLLEKYGEEANAPNNSLAAAEGFLAMEYLKNQLGPQAFPQLLEKLSQHGNMQRAVPELGKKPWAQWKQQFRSSVLSRRFPPSSSQSPAAALSSPKLLRELRLAKLYADSQRNQAAAFHYAKAWALGGEGHASVAQGYVQVLLALSRLEEAERVLASSLSEDTAPAAVWLSLGKLRLRQSAWAKAQKAFESALAQNPFLPEVHLGLYAAAQAQNNSPLANRSQKAAALLLQTSPEAVAEMAKALSAPVVP